MVPSDRAAWWDHLRDEELWEVNIGVDLEVLKYGISPNEPLISN
jgi:hypothetical protein